ncbi:protein crumbs-like isoform X2 [Acanthaster planci]|uniref:Protein crumbs-like isoform X2 n=1 Tax=Acanthaster planci TaxID=133434 RepID=A0A8B7XZZ4_ACAPL|nr:protein crumbs-like isoform X2 [Acanthaster planci]
MDSTEQKKGLVVVLLAIICVCFGSFHPTLAQNAPASKVYFNVSSYVNISTVLNLQSSLGTWLNFRTCDEGEILTQTGSNGDTFTLSVIPSGFVRATWTVGAVSKSADLGPNYATNTKWLLLRLQFALGSIILTVDDNSTTLASASMNSELLAIDLSGGSDVILGVDFVGCMEQVTGLLLDSATSWSNVEWGVCPLEMQQGCRPLCNNPAYSLDCQNGGICLEDDIGNSTYCQCTGQFEGLLCERNKTFVCSSDTCLNNATCRATDTGVQCECALGFSGDDCGINIDECAVHQCLNGGRCIDGIDGYTCNCTGTGYTGDRCSQHVNECDVQPCQNNSTCVDTSGGFVCVCSVGWTGKTCDTDVNECESFPCLNGATCVNLINAVYECQCVQGFNGTNCELNIDDCTSEACPPTFVCVDGVDAFTCECPPGKVVNESGSCEDFDECSLNPCLNGECENLDNNYQCTCSPGFNGTNCEMNIDECDPDPCLMNSTCVDGINGFNCTCLPGYNGELCNVDIDECLLLPCLNSATCVDGVNSFTCECVPGFEGERCENNTNDCLPNPCLNGATCVDEVNDYTCNCIPGFTDKNCSTDIDECQSNQCQNSGTCVDLVNGYQCNCTIDYVGEMCEMLYDACDIRKPCQNGATCTTPPLPSQEYTCTCVPGFNGTNCEINIDDCLGHDCNATLGLVCFDEVNGYRCACPVGFEGPVCADDINECAENPCGNNGTCNDYIGFYNCTCASGFAGVNCEEDIDECNSNPCLNGVCFDDINSYQCYCRPGYSGDNCEVTLNECDSDPCFNGATCIDKLNDVECNCVPGYTGSRCEINIDECDPMPCKNNSTCEDGINEFTCNCAPGYNGTLCEIDIDECAVNPCNLGSCIDGINNYTCNCSFTGFFGPQCENNIDDCAPNPCLNNATCQDLIKDYNCSCWQGYEGKDCSEDINECLDPPPCLNGGMCYQRSNQSLYNGNHPLFPGEFSYANASGFVCQCAPGYEGETCSIDIDECAVDPCANNGTCVDGVNSYTCTCAGGWEGLNCTIEIDECLPEPCKNGATCIDLIDDYECTCTEEYAGRNCTELLTGCVNNTCLNGATCIPSYDETTDTHSFTCQCAAGYTGNSCQTDTSVSFENESYLEDRSTFDHTTLDYSLALQTTLPNGILLYSGQSPSDRFFLLEMFNGDLFLKYTSGGVTVEINDFGQEINDGVYRTVRVVVTAETISLSVTVPQSRRARRTATCAGGVCEQTINIPTSTQVRFGYMYIGGVPDSISGAFFYSQSEEFFTGCMRDIQNEGAYVMPPNTRAAVAPSGCTRVVQCPADRCNYRGVCTDLWTTFRCDCDIGYAGTTCNESFIPATFRFEDAPESYAEFTVDDTLSSSSSAIRLAFRTREPDGLIFFTRDVFSNSHITIEVVDETLTVTASRNSSPTSVILGQGLSNGQYHFVSVTADQTELRVILNPGESELTDTKALMSGDPDFVDFSVGGVADFTALDPDAIVSDTYFKGCLWDVKVNNYSLQFEPLSLPDFPIPSFPMTTNASVLINDCQSDDTCADLPCENGGTCEVTWNDFKCHCPSGFGGKNCSELTICAKENVCPPEAECKDLPDGHECVVDATFNGVSSLVTYTSNISQSTVLNSITLRARTRSDAGIIYHSSNNLTNYFVTLYLDQGKPALRFNLGQTGDIVELVSRVSIKDGSWHDIKVEFSTARVEISVAQISETIASDIQSDFLASVITSEGSSPVHVAGTTMVNNDYFINYNHFKGCLDEVRVGGILLPFYSRDTINSTSEEQFEATIVNVATPCMSEPGVCDSHFCSNSGTCLDVWNDAECQCAPGFTGDRCQIDINECMANPCVMGSTCRDEINNYTCLCLPGYEGRNCDTETNECDPNPCLQGSVCYDGVDFFNCTCLDGYTGTLCDVLINETCAGNPCKNDATCRDTPGSEVKFECLCPNGFDGDDCGQEIDYCVAHRCANGATCNSLRDEGTYSCSCTDGFSGDLCEINEDDCGGVTCQNGGSCVDEIKDYYCNCTAGYEGKFCQNDINECNPNPCQFGATCDDLLNDFNCVCTPGFEGQFCSVDINECLVAPNPLCQNGGICMNTVGSYECICPMDTYGPQCQISPCDPSPCENNATCTTQPRGVYDCLCPLGYEGVNCSVANCSIAGCQNGGTCLLGDGSWECKCAELDAGPLCQYKGPCSLDIDPCLNGGSCNQTFQDDGSFSYMCRCPVGFNGTNCELKINWCDSNPCLHEGSNCTSTTDTFLCSCGPGYTGTFCEIKLPDCASNLCQNGATCQDLDYGYKCHCADGYSGDDCETDIDECAVEPCENGGNCTDAVNDFICNCTGTGYQGNTCSEDVDECTTLSPCLNNGTCANSPGSFKCTCQSGWLPPVCFLADPCVGKPCKNGGRCDYAVSPDGQSVEWKCVCSADYDGDKCDTFIGNETNWALIGGVTGGAVVLLIIVIVLGIFLINVKNKRATRGTYSPSRQEISSSRVEMDNILKLPPEERLI